MQNSNERFVWIRAHRNRKRWAFGKRKSTCRSMIVNEKAVFLKYVRRAWTEHNNWGCLIESYNRTVHISLTRINCDSCLAHYFHQLTNVFTRIQFKAKNKKKKCWKILIALNKRKMIPHSTNIHIVDFVFRSQMPHAWKCHVKWHEILHDSIENYPK